MNQYIALNNRRFNKLFVFSLILCLVFVLSTASSVRAAPSGDVTGTFGINAPPTIGTVSLVETAMTPQVEYIVFVQVTDPDTINDLSTVVLKLWYDVDGGSPLESEYDAIAADSNAQNSAVITWTADDPGGTTYSGSDALTPIATTWSIGVSTLPQPGSGQNPGDFELTTFTFQFVFTVGKVATETSGAAKWQLGAKATDTQAQTSFGFDAEASNLDFYGEIIVPATTVEFGDLSPGSDFTSNVQNLGSTITFITNGDYDEKVSSSATWVGGTFTATLDPSGNVTNTQEFALRADDTATFGNSVLVDTIGVIINDTGAQTLEGGTLTTTHALWVRLASSFSKDTYSGIITYIVANDI